jgi:hypothetical protein
MLDTLAPGLHRGIPKALYLSDSFSVVPSLSASTAKLLVGRSPAHAWSAHPKGGRFRGESTDAQNTGTLLDSLLLGGDTELVVLPDMMPDAKGVNVPTNGKYLLGSAKAWKEKQIAAGRLPVDKDELAFAKSAVDIIRENLARDGVVLDGENQVTAIWEEAGVFCKGRFDHWKERDLIIYDLKKVRCAHPDAVSRAMIEYGWDVQAAGYVRGAEVLIPEAAGRVRFVLLAVEPDPPHEVLVRPLAGSMRALGNWKWDRAMRLWGECLRARKWPGYTGMEQGLEAPAWALAKMEEGLDGGSPGVTF